MRSARLSLLVSLAPALTACAVTGVALTALAVGAAYTTGGNSGPAPVSYGVSVLARREIPPLYLHLYIAAARRYGLDWSVLAGIGKVECDNGRDPAPSCTVPGVENSAGAGGPMQFLASTWAVYGVAVGGGGAPNRWNPADAIFSAAAYLRASGAPGNYRKAIYAYNHAWWYVDEVERWAALYSATSSEPGAGESYGEETEGQSSGERSQSGGFGQQLSSNTRWATSTPVIYIRGEQAKLMRGDGHLALIPTGVPMAVQAMLIAGNELQDLPYGPGGHPDPLGASSEDCSSTVNYVLYRAGIRPLSEIIRLNPLAQSYVHWGDPGPGRWVTIYATDAPVPHVFIVIAGLRLDTSHNGTDEGPNRYENGPRWRLLPYIPTWAHWSVRHPPGL